MAYADIMNRETWQILDRYIPPRITKGQLITGNVSEQKIALPVGPNGSVLQADSTTETGLRWVMPDESHTRTLEDKITRLSNQTNSLVTTQLAQIQRLMSNINMQRGASGKKHSKRNKRTHKRHKS